MKRPIARPINPTTDATDEVRTPRAFAPAVVSEAQASIEAISGGLPEEDVLATPPPKLLGFLGKLLWGTAGLLASLALGLALDRLVRDLFATSDWLGWLGLAVLALFLVALVALGAREVLALSRLRTLDALKRRAEAVLVSDKRADGQAILNELGTIYDGRPDLARGREEVARSGGEIFDGGDIVRFAERALMAPLDARARALTAASARRVALVTTVSPRAMIDIAFVVFESIRLGGTIARLYGARPGFFGTWRLLGAVLSHLAVTGGLVLTDGVVEQLVGQGLAAKLSARLGEGIVNGLMTVRVGIAAMRVVRPLPYATQSQPKVKDFIPELANVLEAEKGQ
jgi:putative membrane protein